MFCVNDRVRIRADSEHYGRHPRRNPADVGGAVIRDSGHSHHDYHRFRVLWDNGYENVYRIVDLEYDEEVLPIEDFL